MLTLEQVVRALPANLKKVATQQMVDDINNAASDPLIAQEIQDNWITYSSVLKDGRYKTEDYLNAVKYVSYKLRGDSNQDAYFKTFPLRYQNLVAKGTSPKDIAAYVSAYNKGQMVNKILEQSLIPTHVLNAHIFQQAINTQVELMTDPDVSPKVRSDAANSLLTHLKKPEAKAEISIDIGENSGMTELRDTLRALAVQQQQLITQGVPTREIAAQKLIEGTAKDVTP